MADKLNAYTSNGNPGSTYIYLYLLTVRVFNRRVIALNPNILDELGCTKVSI